MIRYASVALTLALVLPALGCSEPKQGEYQQVANDPELLHAAALRTTDAMLDGIVSPPVAARTYSYAGVAAYEALRPAYPHYRSLAGQLNELTASPAPAAGADYLFPLASVYAYLTVAEALVFSPEMVAAHRDSVVERFRDHGAPDDLVDRSVAYGESVAKHVLAWADKDRLKDARAAERFVVRREPGLWQPTPPMYMDGVEPNWSVVRPFALDSASAFVPARPVAYDMRPGSAFRKEVMAVYEAGKNLTAEERLIAAFWDCNPYAVEPEGHMTFAMKKITPGGHWVGIAAIAARQSGADIMKVADTYVRLPVALADGFLSAWDEKYRSVLVRPVTVIHNEIDRSWAPLLQTPPFPEYPSGHSVISAAAAEVLSGLYGDSVSFNDDTEVRFGLPARKFTSFRVAAREAAISRLYGGIHYPMGIEHGVTQGEKIGRHIVSRLHTREPALASTR